MAAPISFLSKLFGSKLFKIRRRKKSPEKNPSNPRPRPGHGDRPLKLAEEQRPAKEAPKPEPVDPLSLIHI